MMKSLTQNINVPDGCNILTKVLPIKHLSDHPHVRIFCHGLEKVITDKEMTGQDIRILLGCLTLIDYENVLDKTQKEIADLVGIVQQDVSKSIRKFIAKGWFRVIGKVGRQNIYRVSPKLVLKSRAKNLNHLLEDWEDPGEEEA